MFEAPSNLANLDVSVQHCVKLLQEYDAHLKSEILPSLLSGVQGSVVSVFPKLEDLIQSLNARHVDHTRRLQILDENVTAELDAMQDTLDSLQREVRDRDVAISKMHAALESKYTNLLHMSLLLGSSCAMIFIASLTLFFSTSNVFQYHDEL